MKPANGLRRTRCNNSPSPVTPLCRTGTTLWPHQKCEIIFARPLSSWSRKFVRPTLGRNDRRAVHEVGGGTDSTIPQGAKAETGRYAGLWIQLSVLPTDRGRSTKPHAENFEAAWKSIRRCGVRIN